MLQSSFLTDLLATITNRAYAGPVPRDARSIEELCRVLLSDIGDMSTIKVAPAILERCRGMDADHKAAVCRHQSDSFDIDPDLAATQTAGYAGTRSVTDLTTLTEEAEPRRQEILRRLNRVPRRHRRSGFQCAKILLRRCEPTRIAHIDLDVAHPKKPFRGTS